MPAVRKKPSATAPAPPRPESARALKARVRRFVAEYLVDTNGAAAAVRAGYSTQSARQIASELLARPDVKDAIAAAMDESALRTGITADRVLQRMWAIATADPNELIELRRCCCRYCHGKNHLYQRTSREMADAIRDFERAKLGAEAKGQQWPCGFDPQGGLGFDATKDPASDCPECFGEGVAVVFAKDTRDLSPSAKLLYAGVKKTEGGLEIKMHNQADALLHVGRHLGLFANTVKHANDPANPMEWTSFVIMPARTPRADESA